MLFSLRKNGLTFLFKEVRDIKLFPVAPVTSPPGQVSGEKDLCSLGSEDSTQNFDPWPPGREIPRSPEGSPAKKIYDIMCLFLS